MHDVIIAGAGPAGATCARYLAKLGHAVALIDRDMFPRDKPCGGGFSYNLLRDFPYLRSRESDFLKGISKIGVIHSPNRRISLRGAVDMAVALRYDFDNVVFESAIEEGVTDYSGKRIKRVQFKMDSVSVVTSDGESIDGRVIVGADGVNSLVARQAGLHTRWPSTTITACRVVEVPTSENTIIDIYGDEKRYHFYSNLGGEPGYGWIFPKRDTINVGLGIIGTHAQGLPNVFNRFVKMLKQDGLLMPNADVSSARGALVPTGGPISQTFTNRCLLVGDSCGMVSPLTGGGIAYAMKAARIAAKVISECLEKDSLDASSLGKYQRLWQADFGKDFGPMLIAQKIFTSPFTDLLFEIGQRDSKIQSMVSEAMAESNDANINVRSLILRTLNVCFRAAFHIPPIKS
ncbi:MAG: NAD(P)/FAD-dependent oxidoreductase [Candidatus Thorarchaeota archaeon]